MVDIPFTMLHHPLRWGDTEMCNYATVLVAIALQKQHLSSITYSHSEQNMQRECNPQQYMCIYTALLRPVKATKHTTPPLQ